MIESFLAAFLPRYQKRHTEVAVTLDLGAGPPVLRRLFHASERAKTALYERQNPVGDVNVPEGEKLRIVR